MYKHDSCHPKDQNSLYIVHHNQSSVSCRLQPHARQIWLTQNNIQQMPVLEIRPQYPIQYLEKRMGRLFFQIEIDYMSHIQSLLPNLLCNLVHLDTDHLESPLYI